MQDNPWLKVEKWILEAKSKMKLYDRMSVATASKTGKPSVRTVLFKGLGNQTIQWYSNTISEKGQNIKENPLAEILFYWYDLGRQLRLAGSISKMKKKDTLAYFVTRPFESQVAAYTSRQSQVIAPEININELYNQNLIQFKKEKKQVPLPDYWQGYELHPNKIEFWQEGKSRLHTREVFLKNNNTNAPWKIEYLYP